MTDLTNNGPLWYLKGLRVTLLLTMFVSIKLPHNKSSRRKRKKKSLYSHYRRVLLMGVYQTWHRSVPGRYPFWLTAAETTPAETHLANIKSSGLKWILPTAEEITPAETCMANRKSVILIDWLMIIYIALFSALLSRLTALACTWVTSFL